MVGLVGAGVVLAAGIPVSAQFFNDDFNGSALDTLVWTTGATGGVGTFEVVDGYLEANTGGTNANYRAGIMTNAHGFNPFATPFEVVFSDLAVSAEPSAAQDGSAGIYAVIGRHADDEGSAGSGALAATYAAGGDTYPSALGFQLVRNAAGGWLIELLDNFASPVPGTIPHYERVLLTLSGQPAAITFGIDGAEAVWYLELEGATFEGFELNQLEGAFDGSVATGTFTRFSEGPLSVSGEVVSRLAFGAYNGSFTTLANTNGSFGGVEVRAYNPPPLPSPPVASIFSDYPDSGNGWRNTSMFPGAGIGWIYDAEYPFIWSHDAQGWFYVQHEGASVSSFYAWDYRVNGWIWSSIDWMGYYWDFNSSSTLQF